MGGDIAPEAIARLAAIMEDLKGSAEFSKPIILDEDGGITGDWTKDRRARAEALFQEVTERYAQRVMEGVEEPSEDEERERELGELLFYQGLEADALWARLMVELDFKREAEDDEDDDEPEGKRILMRVLDESVNVTANIAESYNQIRARMMAALNEVFEAILDENGIDRDDIAEVERRFEIQHIEKGTPVGPVVRERYLFDGDEFAVIDNDPSRENGQHLTLGVKPGHLKEVANLALERFDAEVEGGRQFMDCLGGMAETRRTLLGSGKDEDCCADCGEKECRCEEE